MITYKTDKLSAGEISNYLLSCSNDFIPPLKERIDIEAFSLKLQQHAIHFCAKDRDMLAAFAACYFNDIAGRKGYVSTFSVRKAYRNLGIGSEMLEMIKRYGRANGFVEISLRVYCNNLAAIKLYEESGFSGKDKWEYMLMTYQVK